jgi:GNAT superfamily N-acetyltransferase
LLSINNEENAMKITFVTSTNLPRAAEFTFNNMRDYYAQFAPDWDAEKVLGVTAELINYDIQVDSETVGVMRLQYDGNTCILRDLQVIPSAQNKGIGSAAIEEAERLALGANTNSLDLRVFKVSPAVSLYKKWDLSLKVKTTAFLT